MAGRPLPLHSNGVQGRGRGEEKARGGGQLVCGRDLRLAQGPARSGRGSRLHEWGGALGRPSRWWSSDPSSKTRWRGSPEILDMPASWVPAEEGKQTPLPPFLPSLVSDSYLKVLFLPQGEDWFTRVVKLSLPKRFSVNVGQ